MHSEAHFVKILWDEELPQSKTPLLEYNLISLLFLIILWCSHISITKIIVHKRVDQSSFYHTRPNQVGNAAILHNHNPLC